MKTHSSLSLALAAALLAGLLAGCGAAPSGASSLSDTADPAAAGGHAAAQTGPAGPALRKLEQGDAHAYYQVEDAGDGEHTILYRIDLDTGARAPVCDVAGCAHAGDACPAWRPAEAG